MRTILLLILWCPAVAGSQSLRTGAQPDTLFDFWVGEWDLRWEAPDGTMEYGSNKIERILDGRVLLESFEALSGRFRGFRGKSVSVLDSAERIWKQTWVDSDGAYLDFIGSRDGEKRIFWREFENKKGEPGMQRMVFYNISVDSLDWNWESSIDGGESWQLRWHIRYTRSK